MNIPTKDEFLNAIMEYEGEEKRDPMYDIATFLINHFWGNHQKMADGLGVLLLTWNQAFYRYGEFEFDELEKCIINNFRKIEEFRNRDILSLSESDKDDVKELFNEFLEALQIASDNKMKGRKSPVAASKAMHLLAPGFFPLWDNSISRTYRCYYNENPDGKYFLFCNKMKDLANKVKDYTNRSDRTLLKLIDQYNYSKYTKEWV